MGDRPFTDIVYGNRNGFLTILTEPLSVAQEPFIVQQVATFYFIISNLFPFLCVLSEHQFDEIEVPLLSRVFFTN